MIEHLWNDNLVWRIFALPIGWRLWVMWLMTINTACVFFLAHKAAKVVGAVWIGNVVSMMSLYWLMGYVRLLGLSHVIWWTPLFIWLIPLMLKQRPKGYYGTWLLLLTVSDLASLAIDYVDVARYLLGETTAA
jgi:hypothetical protein